MNTFQGSWSHKIKPQYLHSQHLHGINEKTKQFCILQTILYFVYNTGTQNLIRASLKIMISRSSSNESDFDSVSTLMDSNQYLELKFIKRIIRVIHSGIRLP